MDLAEVIPLNGFDRCIHPYPVEAISAFAALPTHDRSSLANAQCPYQRRGFHEWMEDCGGIQSEGHGLYRRCVSNGD